MDHTAHTIFGLSNGDQSQSYVDIEYAIHLQANWPGDVIIFEAGVEVYHLYTTEQTPAYVAGDVFRVAVEGGYVNYYVENKS